MAECQGRGSHRLPSRQFLHLPFRCPMSHQTYSSPLRWRTYRATGSSIPLKLEGGSGAWLVALLLACSRRNRRAILTQLSTDQLHSRPL